MGRVLGTEAIFVGKLDRKVEYGIYTVEAIFVEEWEVSV